MYRMYTSYTEVNDEYTLGPPATGKTALYVGASFANSVLSLQIFKPVQPYPLHGASSAFPFDMPADSTGLIAGILHVIL